MFIRTPRSLVLLTGETCLLLTAVVTGTFMQLGALAVPALSDSGGLLRRPHGRRLSGLSALRGSYDLPRIQNVRAF